MTFFIIICLLFPCQIQSGEEPIGASTLHYCFSRESLEGNKIPSNRTMLIILNDSERGINTTMTNTLASALYQIINSTTESAYCILTSASLLQNIIAARTLAQSVHQALKKGLQRTYQVSTGRCLQQSNFKRLNLKQSFLKKIPY